MMQRYLRPDLLDAAGITVFDAYSWQTVTRKAGFIGQVMRGRLDVREIDDIGDTALSYDEVQPWPPAIRGSSRRPASTPRSPAWSGSNAPTTATTPSSPTPPATPTDSPNP